MKLIHTLPLWINESERNSNIDMMKRCFKSLEKSSENTIVIYNQGCFDNDELTVLLSPFNIKSIIIGEGINIGIAKARQLCFEYIWEYYPDVQYISEIHLDMLFPPKWHLPIIDYLNDTDEPMLSPGIMTKYGELQPLNSYIELPSESSEVIQYLEQLSRNQVVERFVHPVIHKASVLKEIGGYDTNFLKGKQGYEDDSLLLGYLYFMGTRTNWKPKCYLKSWVYHATMAQRMSLTDKHLDFELNEEGLYHQYGAYGLKHLSKLYSNSTVFQQLLDKYSTKGSK